jgi:hypothetical protein
MQETFSDTTLEATFVNFLSSNNPKEGKPAQNYRETLKILQGNLSAIFCHITRSNPARFP